MRGPGPAGMVATVAMAARMAMGIAHVNATINTVVDKIPLLIACDTFPTSKFCQRISSGKLAPFAFTLLFLIIIIV